MTSLAGNFHFEVPRQDATVACADAIDGLGWEIEDLDSTHIVAYADTRSSLPPKIEVILSDAEDGTDVRIIGTDQDTAPLGQDALIAELDRVRDAIKSEAEAIEPSPQPPNDDVEQRIPDRRVGNVEASDEQTRLKRCPDCAEHVQYEARICRYCGYRFDAPSRVTDATPGETSKRAGSSSIGRDRQPPDSAQPAARTDFEPRGTKKPKRGGLRRATQIISLVLMFGLALQSCAVAAGGSISEDLSTTSAEQKEAEDLAGAGGMGILAALLWLIAMAFVMNRPKVSMWLYGVAGIFCLLAGGAGFTDAYIWAGVSFVFAVMSWRGISERERQEEEDRTQYRGDVQAATEAALAAHAARGGTREVGLRGPFAHEATQTPQRAAPEGWYDDPQGAARERYWDGSNWTVNIRD